MEGTAEEAPTETSWREYGFLGKPGEVDRLPPQVAPYHLRLDWLMWFAALSPRCNETWFPRLVERLLEGDPAIRRLLRHDPFPHTPPRWIRARLFRYRFSDRRELRAGRGWWVRLPVGVFLPPVGLAQPTVPEGPPGGRLQAAPWSPA